MGSKDKHLQSPFVTAIQIIIHLNMQLATLKCKVCIHTNGRGSAAHQNLMSNEHCAAAVSSGAHPTLSAKAGTAHEVRHRPPPGSLSRRTA